MTDPTPTYPATPKTLVGVLASHDEDRPNLRLVSLFNQFYQQASRSHLERFHFVFTGGTHDRVFFGDEKLKVPALPVKAAKWLRANCGVTRLQSTREGGVIILSYLISQRKCSIVWPFYAPNANHWQRNENLAFMRLCDQWHVKRLMNAGSVMVWFDHETDLDAQRNLQTCPLELYLDRRDGEVSLPLPTPANRDLWQSTTTLTQWTPHAKHFDEMTIALIAHDEMKSRMIEFAVDHEQELDKFNTILATGTTGREVAAATSKKIDSKMVRYHSGPKGGDIEIATAILYNLCDIVIFFVDPLRPHPHIEDIRVVFQACMVSDQVVMITNEMHAREFMARVVRGHDHLTLYYSGDTVSMPGVPPNTVGRADV